MKDEDVMIQIERMLKDLKIADKGQYSIVTSLLNEVFREFNSGVKRKIDNKLWDMIDAEVQLQLRKK